MNELKQKEICCNIFGWLFQLITWILLIFSIIYKHIVLYIFLGINYLIYIIIEFCSPISFYFLNKITAEEIYQKMNKFFNIRPEIKFMCEVRNHNDNKYHTLNNLLFRYCFSKDISRPFVLNFEKIDLNKKYYIKLELYEKIGFADSETSKDYKIQKNALITKFKRQYSDFNFNEIRHIPGLESYNLIRFKNKDPPFVNTFMFVILTILSLGEFYKIYFNSFCAYQKFLIQKVVTSIPYFNQNEFEKDYENKILKEVKSELKSNQKNQMNISNQIELSYIKDVSKNNKDIEQIITQDINEVNIDKQNNIEINNNIDSNRKKNLFQDNYLNEEKKVSERKNQEKNLDINNESNKKFNKDNNESDSIILVNEKNSFQILNIKK